MSSASEPEATPIAWRAAHVIGELLLEAGDLGAEDEILRIHDPLNRRVDLRLQRAVLRLQIERGNRLRLRDRFRRSLPQLRVHRICLSTSTRRTDPSRCSYRSPVAGQRARCCASNGRQPLAVRRHPADRAAGHADHQRVVRHIVRHHGARGDEGVPTDRHAAHDGGIRAERRAATNPRREVLALAHDVAARVPDVREDHRGAAEDVILEHHAVIQRDVVLDLHVVADDDVAGNEDVLAEIAVPAEARAARHVTEVPDLRALADLARLVDDRRRMREIAAAHSLSHSARFWPTSTGWPLRHSERCAACSTSQDVQGALAVGQRSRAAHDRLQKVPGLLLQRLLGGQRG